MVDEVPEAYKRAAEEVRAHLVALRGGAPFLSPDDARQLVMWLDQGLDVPTILVALERAYTSRRERRSRIPLTLRHAKRHLGKPTKGVLEPMAPDEAPDDHPLRPLVDAVRDHADGDPRGDELHDLAVHLERLPPGDDERLLRGALGAMREFFHGAWDALDDDERRLRLAEARDEFGDVDGVDEATLAAAVEEHARDALRRDYPLLTAATLWDLVHT